MTIGTPPGYAMVVVHLLRGQEAGGIAQDVDRYNTMPAGPQRELGDYYSRLIDSGWQRQFDRSAHEVPCLWFDTETRKCRHHDHRPQICRDFDVGNEHCIRMREEIGVA